MPCDSMAGYTYSGPTRREQEEEKAWRQRIADLEQALCGLCQMLGRDGLAPELNTLHPQLQAWFDKHQSQPGCVVK